MHREAGSFLRALGPVFYASIGVEIRWNRTGPDEDIAQLESNIDPLMVEL